MHTLPDGDNNVFSLVNSSQSLCKVIVIYWKRSMMTQCRNTRATSNVPSGRIALSDCGRLNVMVAMPSDMSTCTPCFMVVGEERRVYENRTRSAGSLSDAVTLELITYSLYRGPVGGQTGRDCRLLIFNCTDKQALSP